LSDKEVVTINVGARFICSLIIDVVDLETAQEINEFSRKLHQVKQVTENICVFGFSKAG
jgi:hypothetical protein